MAIFRALPAAVPAFGLGVLVNVVVLPFPTTTGLLLAAGFAALIFVSETLELADRYPGL